MHSLIAFFSIVQFVNITSKLISFRILYLSEFPCISVGELGVANFNLRAPYNCFNVDIDRAKNFTILKKSSLKFDNEIVNVQYYSENIKFTNNKLPFNFIGLTSETKEYLYQNRPDISRKYVRKVSFAYDPPDESLSFLHDLYNKGIITKKIFGFDFNSENIYIGEIPLNITKYLHHEHCYIVDNEWGCKLNSVYLSNENGNEYTFSSKIKRAVFSFTVEYLSIPKEEFLRLTNFLFEKEIENNLCRIEEDHYRPKNIFLLCNNTDFLSTSNVPMFFHIKLDSFTMTYYTRRMFKRTYGSNMFLIGCYEANPIDEIDIGYHLLEGFNIVFDYDNKDITFYIRNDYMFRSFKHDNRIKMNLFLVVIFIIAIWICCLMVQLTQMKLFLNE